MIYTTSACQANVKARKRTYVPIFPKESKESTYSLYTVLYRRLGLIRALQSSRTTNQSEPVVLNLRKSVTTDLDLEALAVNCCLAQENSR